ncbi:MAG: electron transfer flavoprotein alpha/beta subunit [Dehalococcoidia bacterium]|nr:electron transfer flavoprotein alpha/beta subunit [Dehalococcoidia bacterium]
MNIVVCVKQTPAPAEVRFDESTRTLVREGVTLVISSIDRRALLTAIRLRDEVGGSVTVLTMGPPQAQSALRECLALGADRAVHLTDRVFGGADTLATARTLAQAMRKLAPDLILCGKFTIDSQTGQVPSEVAELLGLPQLTAIRKLRPTESPDILWVERETDEGYEQYHITLPALMSVTELVIASRRPSPEELQAAAGKPLETWSAAELGGDPSLYGAAGSPTRVADLRSARLERTGQVISGEAPEEAAQQLVAYLLDNGLFQSRGPGAERLPRRAKPIKTNPGRAIWVFSELVEGHPRSVTYELLGRAQEMAEELGGEVAALLVGGPSVNKHTATLGAYGADTVYVAANERLKGYDTEGYTQIIAAAVRERKPYMLLFPATTNGRDLAPRVAARLQVGLTGDCVALEIDSNGEVAQIKPAFGGNIVSPIYSRTVPIMATVRPGILTAHKPNRTARPKVISLSPLQDTPSRVRLLESVVEPGLGATMLDDADVVVAVGMGIGGPENVPVVREMAEVMDGALASSLRVSSAGWLPPQVQLGLTGRTVAPRFYIAVGVSGAPNHLVGAMKAEHIIAINTDPAAPIFKSANFGIVGDWAQIVPALTRALGAAKKASIIGNLVPLPNANAEAECC